MTDAYVALYATLAGGRTQPKVEIATSRLAAAGSQEAGAL